MNSSSRDGKIGIRCLPMIFRRAGNPPRIGVWCRNLAFLAVLFFSSPVNALDRDRVDAAWSQFSGDEIALFYAVKSSGEWLPPVQLAREGKNITPTVAERGGIAWVTWVNRVGDDYYTLNYARIVNGEVTDSGEVGARTPMVYAPSIALDHDSNAWLAWSGNIDLDSEIYYSRWLDGGWTLPDLVDADESAGDMLPHVTLDQSSSVPVIRWLRREQGRINSMKAVWQDGQWRVSREKGMSQLAAKTAVSRRELMPPQATGMLMGAVWSEQTGSVTLEGTE